MWWQTGFVTTYDNAEGRWENNIIILIKTITKSYLYDVIYAALRVAVPIILLVDKKDYFKSRI